MEACGNLLVRAQTPHVVLTDREVPTMLCSSVPTSRLA
ncbi:hypothetical protein TI01_0694 [Lysobacter sp. A03]|nr:hypothetical protein TI01_0694 [Lysobacter sp. A03]